MCSAVLGSASSLDAVVDDHPSVPGQDRRRAAADFELLPGRHRTGQPVMQGKVAEVIGLIAGLAQWTVGNPDALSMEIHDAGRRLAGRFLRTSPGKERPVEDRHCRLPIRIGNGDGEDAGILIVHAVELDAFIRAEGREPQTLPVEQVLR